MLVLVVGSQRERAGRGRCSSLLVNGDKKEGEKRAKRNPNQFFAPSARMSRRQMFDSVVVCRACDAIQWILDRRVELERQMHFSNALIIRHYFQRVHF